MYYSAQKKTPTANRAIGGLQNIYQLLAVCHRIRQPAQRSEKEKSVKTLHLIIYNFYANYIKPPMQSRKFFSRFAFKTNALIYRYYF